MSDNSTKSSTRIKLNSTLIAICIGIFFFIINFKGELLFQKILFIQLVLAIPLFLTSTLAYSKVGYRKQTLKWNALAWISFIFGYAFILNSVGILIRNFISVYTAIIFFMIIWFLTLVYSFVDISYDKSVIKERLSKDALFILIQLILGVFVVLGYF